jgi:colicin import membrane protein
MNRGLTISCIGHAAALLFAVVTISAQPMEVPATPTMPVDFISDTDFSKLTQGIKNAPQLKIPDPKPLADKVDVQKSVDQIAPKVADKPAITTDTQTKPTPTPDTKQADKAEKAKVTPSPDAKPTDKPDKAKAVPDYKPDQIADILKKDAAKNPPPKPDDKPKRDNTPKFDPSQVAALLDHRDPRRQVASAENVNPNATLGASAGTAAQLSQSEIDAFKSRISQCWNPPAGVDGSTRVYVVLRVQFRNNGTVGAEPVVVEGSASALGPALAESGKRALLSCQPFTMLKPEHYDQWKDIELKFDPHELLGG